MEKPVENLEQKKQEIVNAPKKQEVHKTQPEKKIIEPKKEQTITDSKKPETPTKKIMKDEAVVNIKNAPVSTKYSMAFCKFIKNKQIEKAINELEQVLVYKKAIPMKGGVGHKKSAGGYASGSGKYPQDATKYFIGLLKSLSSNAAANELKNPVIVEAFANIGQKPRARFGKWKRKRTHLRLVARELKIKNKEKIKNKKQGEKN